ncbi:amino-acid N-acetyltransferase [Brucepastera parasyntrophica]|uniref:amino-acid N-acetyltransferase n=1 Tax=Brucepastera parasyntrophica TaxID=2880008 RepID=UPI002109D865|nr:amino-acid N-acetyltransferase [Brucepastera parasyntrophica]ULQ58780.1 amino-acid N-acetyltransferase [Brucepastera parasyntrophica]
MLQTERIRDVIRYIQKFKGSTIVVRIDDNMIDFPLFAGHVHDLSLLHDTGMKIVVVPGAQTHISRVLDSYGISWSFCNKTRITDESGMNLIKMAAFDVSNRIMTHFSSRHLTAVIGNWVQARGYGVLNGTDYGSAGFVEKIDLDALRKVIDDGFIPILPCVGWTATGKPYNLSSDELAVAAAIALKADKLFFIGHGTTIFEKDYNMPANVSLEEDGRIAAIAVDDIETFIRINREKESVNPAMEKIVELLRFGKKACLGGVTRAHILNGDIDGVIPAEIFSELGSGTMIYRSDYGTFRGMTRDDIPSVLSLMNPFVENGTLLPRSAEILEQDFPDYTVYEIDGGIRACAALHLYEENTGEIAGIAVDEAYAHMGIGPKMMERLIEQGKKAGLTTLFVLTTQASDWFERFGFRPADIAYMPEERRKNGMEKENPACLYSNFEIFLVNPADSYYSNSIFHLKERSHWSTLNRQPA